MELLPVEALLEAESIAVLGLGFIIAILLLFFQQRTHNRNTKDILDVVQRQTDNHTKQIDTMAVTNKIIGDLEHAIEKELVLLDSHDKGAITRQNTIIEHLSEVIEMLKTAVTRHELVEKKVDQIIAMLTDIKTNLAKDSQ